MVDNNNIIMNNDEYDILLKFVERIYRCNCDHDDFVEGPKNFIISMIEKNKIKCNDSGKVTNINFEGKFFVGHLPAIIGNLSSLQELVLLLNSFDGPIPSSLGNLQHLERLDLGFNHFSGYVPTSIGNLKNLKYLNLERCENLSGGLPSMVSKECNIDIRRTGISRVNVKTKPLENYLDYFFVISHVVLGYVDLVFDILAIVALSSSNIPVMVANILFVLLNVALGIWMSKRNVWGILRTVFQVDQLYQGYTTIVNKYQTHEMIISKKIDAVTRSLPSMVLQLYGLLKSLSEPDNSSHNSLFDRFLTPSQTLLLSVATYILGAGFTLASLAPNTGGRIFNKHFVIHYVYYTVEITNRVVILSVMFFSVNAYGFIVAVLEFLIRMSYGYNLGNRKDSLLDVTLLAIQSFGSDHAESGVENRLLYVGFAMNTVEMFIFFVVLGSLKARYLEAARSQGDSTILTIVGCITWLIRLVFYLTRVLDIETESMASKEEGAVRGDTNTSGISVNRIE